ncbi:hypothetical protein GJ744_008191 [Endocarpon pusillum]|uniref:Uncharacterized protein n=1 Tax=Endocarpon pusillum TaxID=364733 RepID=A0A8H7AJV9_9EURO|nr:hypothetical protein GJ744_008191 [Endocarpon pusillum]
MFRRVFGAQESVSPSLLQRSPYQDDPHLRAEAHPLQHQWGESPEEQFQDQRAGFSLPRKPIAHGTASTRAVDQNGCYQEVNPGVNVSKNQSSSQSRFLSTWWLEIICCVLFIGALAAVVITVTPYEGRLLPQWPYRLSINTLIAVYMIILKAAMLLVAAEGLTGGLGDHWSFCGGCEGDS